PDPDAGRLQRKPHALLRHSERLDGLLPLADVRSGTERAHDASFVVSQLRVAPLDQAFLARPRENRLLADGMVASAGVVETLAACVAHPLRQTGLDPVAPEQLALRAS